jgi:peptidyl-prolyl cis-trans isomerase B (cyclophilin B)
MLFALAGCGKNNASDKVGQEETSAQTEGENIVKAQITMENGGVIDLELYPDIAPITVENFKSLCEEGFYDGLTFHRIISGFMIQGGDPEGTGTGGPGYSIKGEFELNGVQNDLKHERGVISMARSQNYDSAGSQFFIMHEDADYLDGSYAAFGRVVDGMDVVDEIAATPVSYDGSTPLEAPVIESIKIIED